MSFPETPIDPIWTSSRTARQIYALGQVDKDIARLLSLAASSISLLTLPQTDPKDGTERLPQGEERSEQFVLEVSEYFERLDAISEAIRSSLAHIRHSRIAPSAINAPPVGFVPATLGVGVPSASTASTSASSSTASAAAAASRAPSGLQEERIERDAWIGILNALERLQAAKAEHEEQEGGGGPAKRGDEDTEMS